MQDYLDLFKDYLESTNKSDITIKQYSRELEIFFSFLESKNVLDVSDIRTIHIDLYRNLLMKKNVSSSVKKKMYTLKSFFKFLYTRKYIPENPMDITEPIRIKDSDRKKKDNLTSDEVVKFMNAVEKNSIPSMALRNKVLMMSFLFFGVRVSELCSLRVSDISFKEKTVYINDGKGGKNREVPMFEELKEDFKEYIKTRNDKEFLFSVKKTDKQLSSRAVLDLVKRHIGKSKINKNIGCHALRRTAATLLLEDGFSPTDIQRFLGHSSINTTMYYLNSDIETTKDKIRKGYSLAKKVKKVKGK